MRYLVIVETSREPQVWAAFAMLSDAEAYVDALAISGSGHTFTILEA